MIKIFTFLLSLVLLSVFFSCVGLQPEPEAVIPPDPVTEIPPEISPEITREKPVPSIYIMGEGKVDKERLAFFLIQNNPSIDLSYVLILAGYYIEEAAFEGVNHDVAFIQMCLETGFLGFGNLVTPEQFNFAGLGATGLPDADGVPDKGLYFPDPRIGVRAHVQHLKAYASPEPLNGELVNPRRRFVRLGSSPTIEGLAGTWAADRQYAVKLNAMLDRLYDFAF